MEELESSIFLRCLKKVGQVYLAIEEKIGSVYLSSFTHCLIGKGTDSIKIGFKFSIFGRLTEIEQGVLRARDFFQISKTVRIALSCTKNLKDKLTASSARGVLITSIKSLKCDFFSKPLKVGGIIVITMIITNLVLSIILQRQITLWGWVMRGLLLFVGISGLFCNTDWPTMRNYSLILRKTSSRVK